MKHAALALALSLPSLALAAGPYDGVYKSTIGGTNTFLSVHQSGEAMMVAMLDKVNGTWDALQGTITPEGAATLRAIYTGEGTGNATVEIDFREDGTGVFEVMTCEAAPGSQCAVTPGDLYVLKKIF